MARPIDEFVAAWDALSCKEYEQGGGWHGIPVKSVGSCRLVAARRFPGNEEALLACFPAARLASSEQLPDGNGFEVVRADPYGDGETWISLSRRESGSPELFAEMVGDVAGAMDAEGASGEERILKALLRRVKMWQQFMARGQQPLGPEAELGLIGELDFLTTLLDAGAPVETILEWWVGPDDAPQDFVFKEGAVEVKATLATSGFPAKIGSLEQLDDAIHSPLFIVAARFSRTTGGSTLPEIVSEVERRFALEPGAVSYFKERLLTAGYLGSHAAGYSRRFNKEEACIYAVTEGFPRLVRGSVPDGVARVLYEIDLVRAADFLTDFPAALRTLGVLK